MSLGETAVPHALSRGKPGSPRARLASRAARAVPAALLVLLLPGCAYYNTFFQAKKDYAKALRIEETSKTDRLPPEAIKCYDQAIERCGKVIVSYEGGWRAGIDDALFLMGQCYYGKREYETAIGKFNEVILNYPDSDHVPEALFYSGICYEKLRNHAIAAQIFDNLMQQYPRFARADEILFISAEGRESANDPAGALRRYERILSEFPKSRQREKAWLRVGEIHFEATDYDSALSAYEELARSARDDDVYIEAQLRRGACLVRLDRPLEALSVYQRILPENPEREELGGRVWLAMADACNRAGKHDEALEKLALVAENFQNRPAAIEAWFTTGYTHEVYLKQYEQAREAYQKAAEDRTRSVFKDQATRRLDNLQNLIELQGGEAAGSGAEGEGGGESDPQQLALAALKVAEFSLLESRDPRTALEQYAAVERDFPESDMALRAAYARGWILYDELDSLERAGEVLDSLIEAHPGTGQAEGALDLLKRMAFDAGRLAALDSLVAQAKAVERARADSIAAAEEADRIANEARAAARADSLAQISAARAQGPGAPGTPGETAPGGASGEPELGSMPAPDEPLLQPAGHEPAPSDSGGPLFPPGGNASAPSDSGAQAPGEAAPAGSDAARGTAGALSAPADSSAGSETQRVPLHFPQEGDSLSSAAPPDGNVPPDSSSVPSGKEP